MMLLAQVNGRNLLSWDKRLNLDVWYVENWNLKIDILILFITINKTLFRKGFVENPNSIMLNFDEERRLVKLSGIE